MCLISFVLKFRRLNFGNWLSCGIYSIEFLDRSRYLNVGISRSTLIIRLSEHISFFNLAKSYAYTNIVKYNIIMITLSTSIDSIAFVDNINVLIWAMMGSSGLSPSFFSLMAGTILVKLCFEKSHVVKDEWASICEASSLLLYQYSLVRN